ncbi:uncharacterized protein LOC130731795 [Lotus japonicus]|uniref:uncharacterized protein LOC130731795 n=1 Tax=Lotus japonicus TaxID=34305 RepID=UPI00258CD448|nr:uncharacterized protein LOC130731795 [Lotus japonicus]
MHETKLQLLLLCRFCCYSECHECYYPSVDPPPLAEVVTIRDGLALHGIEADMPLAESEDDDDVHILTQEEEFLTLYPRKDLKELNETEEDGVFTVVARVTSLAEGEKWWYFACSCHNN